MQNRSSYPFELEYLHIENSGEFPVKIWSKERYKLDDNQISRLHFHNYLEIGYCFEGGGVFIVDGKILPFKKGDACVIFAKQVHIAQSEKDTVSLWNFINLDHEKILSFLPLQEIAKVIRTVTAKSGIPCLYPKDEYGRINMLVYDIITEFLEEKNNYHSAARSLLWLLFIELERLIKSKIPEDKSDEHDGSIRLLPAIDYIAGNYFNQIYIKDLAFLCNTSVRNFRRLFKQTYNLSPIEYIIKFRVEMSGILLRSSDYSILEVSEKSGFDTLSSFNRHFKNIMGVTPRDWRKNRGAEN